MDKGEESQAAVWNAVIALDAAHPGWRDWV